MSYDTIVVVPWAGLTLQVSLYIKELQIKTMSHSLPIG